MLEKLYLISRTLLVGSASRLLYCNSTLHPPALHSHYNFLESCSPIKAVKLQRLDQSHLGFINDRIKKAEKRLEQNTYDVEAWSILLEMHRIRR
ncbi:hypothetical protein CEXT_433231 [Caerostris extrusa]|uniref:Uncharacterized protein n=1 Tax=Caerostris extrusa TaxID=172846 RepID=A0AAV4MMS0_CAEEX|nr:hypothetical protein CEXT_433231 [Caerostris extrusa]